LASIAMLGLTLGVAQSEPTARESFDHGTREYEARRFARAERYERPPLQTLKRNSITSPSWTT